MNTDPIWVLAKIFLINWGLYLVSNLIVHWRFRHAKKKAKWRTDDELLTHEKHRKEYFEKEGRKFDLWDELSRAMARQDYNQAKKKLELAENAAAVVQFLSQGVVVYFAYQAYQEDQKLFLLLALVFLWRSLNYWGAVRSRQQTLAFAYLRMAHPAAEQEFFASEHCLEGNIKTDRAYDLLKRDGYFNEAKKV